MAIVMKISVNLEEKHLANVVSDKTINKRFP